MSVSIHLRMREERVVTIDIGRTVVKKIEETHDAERVKKEAWK